MTKRLFSLAMTALFAVTAWAVDITGNEAITFSSAANTGGIYLHGSTFGTDDTHTASTSGTFTGTSTQWSSSTVLTSSQGCDLSGVTSSTTADATSAPAGSLAFNVSGAGKLYVVYGATSTTTGMFNIKLNGSSVYSEAMAGVEFSGPLGTRAANYTYTKAEAVVDIAGAGTVYLGGSVPYCIYAILFEETSTPEIPTSAIYDFKTAGGSNETLTYGATKETLYYWYTSSKTNTSNSNFYTMQNEALKLNGRFVSRNESGKGDSYTLDTNGLKAQQTYQLGIKSLKVGDKVVIEIGSGTFVYATSSEKGSATVNGQLFASGTEITDKTTFVITSGDYMVLTPKATGATISRISINPVESSITIPTLEGGTITASPNPAMEGEKVTLTITPGTGNQLKSSTLKAYKTGDESMLVTIGADNTFTMPAYGVTVTAEFEAIPANTHTITLPDPDNLVGGTVTVTTAAVAKDETVTLNITPDTGYEVDQVTVEGAPISPENGTYKFTMPDNDVTVSVTFKKKIYTLTFSSADPAMGSVSVDPTATDNRYEHGAVVTITAMATGNNEFDYWTVDEVKDTQNTSATLTVTMTANKTVVATFKEKEVVKEQFVGVEKTWYFDEYDEGDYYGTNTNWKVSDKLYARSISSKKFTIVSGESQELTFKDGTKKTVTKYAQANAAGGNSTSNVITAATTGTNDLTPSFAFNTTVPGTCYVLMQEAGSEHKDSYRQRIFFGDGKSAVSSVVSSSVSGLTEIAEISYSAATAGTFVIGSTTNPSNIYAIRFVPTPTYTVKATAGTGGTVSIKDGNGNAIISGSAIAEGTKLVLTATPDAANDYGFKNWTKADGTEVSTDAEYIIESLSEDIDVTANFEQVITYTVTTPEVTGGTVAITAGDEAIGSGSKIPAGTEVTVTATPSSGYYFVNWGSDDLTDNPYTFTPTASTTLTAKFEAYPGTITYDFMGAYDADKNEIVCTGDETAKLHYIRTDGKSASTNALFVNTPALDLNGRISTSENSLTYVEKGITIKSGRAIAIHNLKENDVIRIEFDGELYYAWNNSKSERESNALADISTGDMIKTMMPYTVSSINATNNYVVFYTGAATTISQISINQELVLKSVPKPTVSSTYTVNEDSYTYTIEYMEGATLYYTLPGGEEQSKSGGESLEVNVTKLGDLTAYAKYGDLTSETASQRVYAPTPKIESNGVYDFSQVSSVMLKDYTLGTIGYGDAVTIGEIVLYKPDAVVAKTLDRFAFAPKVNEKGSNAGDWMLLGAGRLRAKNTVADTLAVLNLKQGEYVTFTYSGAELKYMSESTATLAEDTDVLTSGQGYEVKSDGILLLTIPVTDGKNCDITKIAIVNEETVTAPTVALKSADVPDEVRITPGTSSFGKTVKTYYTTDGSEPSAENGTEITSRYKDLTLEKSCTVKAIAISETGVTSVTTTVSYIQSEDAGTKNEVKELVSVVDENNATVTSLIIGEDITTVTISAEADGVPVTAIAENLFTVENTATVGAIDLSGTAIAVSGDRSAIPELKNINPATLVYVPSTAVTGTNVVTKTGTGDNATYGCTDYQVYDQKLEEDGLACSVPHDFHADNATLVREFTSNVKCTVCLPYPFKATGGTFYYFKGISGNTVQMQAVQDGETLEANTPYIFEPASNMDNLSATSVDVSISNAPQTENTEANFTFVGTYKTIVWDNPRGIYGFAAEGTSRGQFVRVGNGASIVACRAYLEYTEGKLNGAATRSVNSLPDKLDVEWIPAASNDGTTGIMGTEQQTAADEPVYNLNGQRVNDSYKGLIIKNGKKMVKK